MSRAQTQWRAGAIAALVLGVSSCASVEQRAREDRETVQGTVGERLSSVDVQISQPSLAAELADELLADGLSSADAVRLALVGNPMLSARSAELGIASADVVAAQRLPNPVLSANAKFFSSGTEFEFGLVQPFLELLTLAAKSAAAEAERDVELAALARDAIHLVFEVRREFCELARAQLALELERENSALEQNSYDLMARLHAAGNNDDRQLAQAIVSLSNSRLRLESAQLAFAEAREPINRLVGLWGPRADWELQGSALDLLALAHIPHAEDAESRAIEASLELRGQRSRVDWAARRAGVVMRTAALPDASLGLAAKREPNGSWGLGPAFELSLPIFDQGDALRSRADAQLEQAAQHYRALQVDIRSAARVFALRADAARTRAQYLSDSHVPALARVVREELRHYNAMQTGVFDVLMARSRELEASRSALEAARDARAAQLDFEELMAGSLAVERLAAPATSLSASGTQTTQGGH
jgi:cobalt-zinc-cadmium efflux system outer membrane protein